MTNAKATSEESSQIFTNLITLLNKWPRRNSCLVIGIAGPPGAGKSTLAKQLLDSLDVKVGFEKAYVSLDDFYFTPDERIKRGYKWRALPGTHDIQLLSSFLTQLKSNIPPINIPRYDCNIERTISPQQVNVAACDQKYKNLQ